MELDLSQYQPDWRGDEHPELFHWEPEMVDLYPRDELLEEGSVADWGMLVDTVHELQAAGKPLTHKAICDGINEKVLQFVEQTCQDFEALGLGRNTPDGRFIPFNDDWKDFPSEYP